MLRYLLAALALVCVTAHAEGRLLVFAAASLKDALDEASTAYGATRVTVSYGASSALARQIENGAPADIFISADLDWMAYLEKLGLLAPGTRRNLVGNQLVLVAPAAHPVKLQPAPNFPISAVLKDGRIALADPRGVPAGKYAKAAFEKLGVWQQISGRIAAAENVRAALALVARDEAPLGVVYRTDAAAEPRVVVAGVFPADSHPPIVYPAAALKGSRRGARSFLGFLSGPRARAIFEKYGFTVN